MLLVTTQQKLNIDTKKNTISAPIKEIAIKEGVADKISLPIVTEITTIQQPIGTWVDIEAQDESLKLAESQDGIVVQPLDKKEDFTQETELASKAEQTLFQTGGNESISIQPPPPEAEWEYFPFCTYSLNKLTTIPELNEYIRRLFENNLNLERDTITYQSLDTYMQGTIRMLQELLCKLPVYIKKSHYEKLKELYMSVLSGTTVKEMTMTRELSNEELLKIYQSTYDAFEQAKTNLLIEISKLLGTAVTLPEEKEEVITEEIKDDIQETILYDKMLTYYFDFSKANLWKNPKSAIQSQQLLNKPLRFEKEHLTPEELIRSLFLK